MVTTVSRFPAKMTLVCAPSLLFYEKNFVLVVALVLGSKALYCLFEHQLLPLYRVRTGHGKPGKSWNLSISVSRPGKSWNLIFGYGKAWKIIVCVVRKLLQVSISKDKIKYRQVMSEDTRKQGRFSKVAAKL